TYSRRSVRASSRARGSPMTVQPHRVAEVGVLNAPHVAARDRADLGRAHAAQPLHELVPLAVVPEVQLRTGEKFGLVGGARILGEVIEREAVDEATQGEIVQLAG